MSCPQPSAADIKSMLDQANSLFANIQEQSSCDEECQNQRALDLLKTKLEDARAVRDNADEHYDNANREYIIGNSGTAYYTALEAKKKQEDLEKKAQANIDYFLIALNSTKTEAGSLEKELKYLELIKTMYENNNVTGTLNDVFGIEVPASLLRNDFTEGFETISDKKLDLETLNRKIMYEYTTNSHNENINKILYVIYYILLVCIGLFLFTREFKNIDRNKKIGICVLFLLYPYIKIVFSWLYNIYMVIYRFVV